MKRVLIGCPTCYLYKYALEEYINAIKRLDYPYYEIMLVDNSPHKNYLELIKKKGIRAERISYYRRARDRIVNARNLLREVTIKERYDYLFSVEQDIIIPPDTLNRLISYNKKVVSALYTKPVQLTIVNEETGQRNIKNVDMPVVYFRNNNGKIIRPMLHDVYGKGLIQVGNVGLGCILISRDVLERIVFRYEKDRVAFDDMYFGLDCMDNGIPIYLDSDLLVKHDDRIKWENIIEK